MFTRADFEKVEHISTDGSMHWVVSEDRRLLIFLALRITQFINDQMVVTEEQIDTNQCISMFDTIKLVMHHFGRQNKGRRVYRPAILIQNVGEKNTYKQDLIVQAIREAIDYGKASMPG